MQSVPLEGKIIMSQLRIREWFDHFDGQVYVSFSGGKDSTVLKHLVETTSGVYNVPVVFVDTGLEYPEVRMFARKHADVVIRPEMRFDEVIKKYGYPVPSKEISRRVHYAKKAIKEGRQEGHGDYMKLMGLSLAPDGTKSRYNCEKWKFLLDAPFEVHNECCNVMKKNPAKKYVKETGRVPFLGTMASESLLRRNAWMRTGCNAFEKNNPSSQPMSFWTEQDVLAYIKKFNLEYAKVYGDIEEDENGQLYMTGVNRTGCMFCMFGVHLDKKPNRFQRMKETHPRQWEYCMNKLGIKDVLEYIGVPYE